MKKLFIALLTASAFALPVLAQPSTYYVAGDFQGWSPGTTPMTETSSGIWQLTTNMSVGRHEFKITGTDWSWNYPGANSWLYTDGSGNVTITYDVNTYADGWSPTSQRIGLNVDPGSWTAAGNFQVAAGEASDWNNAAGNMASLGGGIYVYSLSVPGDWEWKPVVTGTATWDSISWDNRSVGTANWAFTVNAGEVANLYVDAFAGTAKVEIVPEPSTIALLGVALAGFFALRRRQ